MALLNLKTQTQLNPLEMADGLYAFFTFSPNSDFAKTQQDYLQNLTDEVEKSGIKIMFLSPQKESSDTDFYFDEHGDLLMIGDKLNPKNPSEGLLLLNKIGSDWSFADFKESPENQYNWIEALVKVGQNYANDQADDEGYWKWGQIVPETAEYLCKDCGLVLELEQGQIFPICEVCLAGEPSGPSGPDEGYWEKV